jgi:hypothetical protein
LIELTPESAAGIRSEPAVSVPTAAGTMRAASAAADPPLDPPAVRSSAHGLPTWSVVPPAANSWVWLWPARTMPWPRRRRHTVLSVAATLRSRTRLEAVRPLPPTAKRSLSASGIPHTRGAALPSRSRRSSAARASSFASSGYRRAQALTASGAPSKVGAPPLRAAIRAWHASRSSTAEIARERSNAVASSRPRSAGSVALGAGIGGRYRQPSASSVRVDHPDTRA